MTSIEYLIVMCKKAMEKATKDVIKETCCKKWEENMVRKFANYLPINLKTSQHVTTSNVRANCEYNWSATIVREVGYCMNICELP
jgi:hypothetical protein